jgi:hypothetical protein
VKSVFLIALAAVLSAPAARAQAVAGEWDASYNTPGGVRSFKIVLAVQGDSLRGTVKRSAGDAPLTGTITGDVVTFSYTIEYGGNALVIAITAKVTGDTMSGTANFGGEAEEEFSARRSNPAQFGATGGATASAPPGGVPR